MACQKPILMLLMKANFIALLFDFTAMPPGNPSWGCGAACVCVKMHSTQNVDKLVKTLHEVGKTGDKAETNRSFSYRKKSHLKCQMWCVFLGLCPLRFPSLPTPRSGKDNISAGILHKFSFQCRTRNRRQEEGWGCRGMRLPNVCSIFEFLGSFRVLRAFGLSTTFAKFI